MNMLAYSDYAVFSYNEPVPFNVTTLGQRSFSCSTHKMNKPKDAPRCLKAAAECMHWCFYISGMLAVKRRTDELAQAAIATMAEHTEESATTRNPTFTNDN